MTPIKLATGTGFYQLTPSLTVLHPTAPGVLFANLQFQHNLARTQPIQDCQGGPPIEVNLQPGEAPSITFGIGFALKDWAALTLSYQQRHIFTAYANGQTITGSPYSFGRFNFGLGYQISQSTRLNPSVGIGTRANTPAAKVLLEVPYRFSLWPERPKNEGPIDGVAASPRPARAGIISGPIFSSSQSCTLGPAPWSLVIIAGGSSPVPV